MSMTSRTFWTFFLGWVAAVGLATTLGGCGGSATESENGGGGGPVVVDGSSTVFRISKAAQEQFAKVNDKVEVIVNYSGTGGGFSKYLNNELDIVDASRPAKPEEES